MAKEEQKNFILDGNFFLANVTFLAIGYYALKHVGNLVLYFLTFSERIFVQLRLSLAELSVPLLPRFDKALLSGAHRILAALSRRFANHGSTHVYPSPLIARSAPPRPSRACAAPPLISRSTLSHISLGTFLLPFLTLLVSLPQSSCHSSIN